MMTILEHGEQGCPGCEKLEGMLRSSKLKLAERVDAHDRDGKALMAEHELAERLSIEVAELGKKVYDANQARDYAQEQLGLWKENFSSVVAAKDSIVERLNACRAKLHLAEARVERLESGQLPELED
jgi:hypothetical protein